ncbi:MAG: aspartate carbamoyltransferase catalytic subunit [Chloroflexi bacterium]|nr:aspartate carbamoyltransferase catalytic subunit [Chloroflexota bacterium]
MHQRRHILDLDDFSRDEIVRVFDAADSMREVMQRDIKKVPTLRGKVIVTLFYEASTRTRVSFEIAGKALSADVVNLSASGSCVSKGVSLVDTVRTLEAMGIDAVVVRHSASGAPYLMAQHLRTSVINAGDGWHAHPTQALLDLYTMRGHFGALDGLKVVIVGDVLHSRVARSNLWGLHTMGAEVVVCAPPTLVPAAWRAGCEPQVEPPPSRLLPPVRLSYDLDEALPGADVIMVLRLQRERQQSGLLPTLREYSRRYGVNAARVALARPNALVMHPGPVNEGVEIAPDVAHGAQSVIEEQVRNGVAIRMALLYQLLGGR